MILNCISPKGDPCTVRVKLASAYGLISRLKRLGFHQFESVPEYGKFHNMSYCRDFGYLYHFTNFINSNVEVPDHDLERKTLEFHDRELG